jgi:hypothetical protein
VLFSVATLFSQETIDQNMIARIKIEAIQNSKVMETVSMICDVHGPRLTGSTEYKEAADWCVSQLQDWGISNAALETWPNSKNAWSIKKFDIAMTAPRYDRIIGYPEAWTPPTHGLISGEPMLVEIDSKDDFEEYEGKLDGKIIMNGKVSGSNPNFQPVGERVTADELAEMHGALNTSQPNVYKKGGRSYRQRQRERNQFYLDQGVAAVIEPSWKDHAIVTATSSNPAYDPDSTVPSFIISKEQYGRIQRILETETPVTIELQLETEFSQDSVGYNVVAEIPGTDRKLKDQVVMIGAHLDSWHAGTGATDNGANCATMMEVMRILKKINFEPRRTIRIGLWGGEEQGYLGSHGYVKKHFGNTETLELLPEHENLSAYLNIDNGSGKIRGIHLQGNEYARPIFKQLLEPFDYLDANTITSQSTSGTDHIPFNWIGLPAFQFIQDPIEYFATTWHTNLDVYEALLPDDIKQNVAIIASLVYHLAMRDDKMPREDMPELPAKQVENND